MQLLAEVSRQQAAAWRTGLSPTGKAPPFAKLRNWTKRCNVQGESVSCFLQESNLSHVQVGWEQEGGLLLPRVPSPDHLGYSGFPPEWRAGFELFSVPRGVQFPPQTVSYFLFLLIPDREGEREKH